jgi:hypothetical protein
LLHLLQLQHLMVPRSRWRLMPHLQQQTLPQQRRPKHLSKQPKCLQLLTKLVRRLVRAQVLMLLQRLLRMVWMWISRLQQRLQLHLKQLLLPMPLLRSRLRWLLARVLQQQLQQHQLLQQQHSNEQSVRGSGKSSVRRMRGCRQWQRGLWLSPLRLWQSARTWTMTLR